MNRSQSSNDTFPTAMHIAAASAIVEAWSRASASSATRSTRRAEAWDDIVKIGRTHLQDAVPLTLGQELGGYVAQLDAGVERIEQALPGLYELAIGGTAVGTGLNAPEGFGEPRRPGSPTSPASRSARHRTSSPRSRRTTAWCS